MRLMAIDGTSWLHTNFHGTAPKEYYGKTDEEKQIGLDKMMKTADGIYTNAVYGMTKNLIKLIKTQKPTHLVITWDISRDTFRKQMYDGYKASRSDTKPELKMQFAIMQDVLDSIGIKQFKVENYEADDILGTFAKKFENDIPVKILTKDQDALQLISNNTSVWLNTSKAQDLIQEIHGNISRESYQVFDGHFEYTPETFKHVYGINPIQMIDKKAIEGDASDDIPGVKGVGKKAVLPLLQHFETIEKIYEYIENTEEKEAKEFFKSIGVSRSPIKPLIEQKDIAFLSKKLATIECQIKELDEVKLEDLKLKINNEGTIKKFKELQFDSLLK